MSSWALVYLPSAPQTLGLLKSTELVSRDASWAQRLAYPYASLSGLCKTCSEHQSVPGVF